MFIAICVHTLLSTIKLWVLSIYSFIKHYTVVILCITPYPK